MSLNHGIQKYRDHLRKSSDQKAKAHEKKKEDQQKYVDENKSKTDTSEMTEAVDAATILNDNKNDILKEEEKLRIELSEEIKNEEKQTSKLVREDYSPANSTRDQLILEYSPLIKYIAQKI